MTPGPANLGQSSVALSSASVLSGASITATLTVKDAYGNQLTSGGLTVAIGLGNGSAGGSFGVITDNHNGTYSASFTAASAGSDTITATIGGQAVTSAAASLTVSPLAVNLAQSTVSATATNLQAGGTITVTLTAKDANGNQQTTGGLSVAFGLGTGAGRGTFSSVTDNHNGTYTATFTATTAGSNSITATIGGQAVTSTAPTVTVVPGAASVAQSLVALAPGSLQSGNTATVTLTVKDANGNRQTSGGLAVAFALGSGTAGGSFGPVTDNHDGTYTSTFTATIAGTNSVGATIGGQAVSSTAPTVTVTPGSVSLSQSLLSVTAANIQAGNPVTVTLTARDASGNRESSGGLTVAFALGGGGAGGTFGTVTDNHDGTYTSAFTATTTGTGTITATIGGQAVSSAPPAITVTPGTASLVQSVVNAAPAAVQAGSTLAVTLTAKDSNGNLQTSGGLNVAFGLGSGTAAGTFSAVVDNHNGTYTATFTAMTAGTNTITATIGGQAVGSPAPSVTVTPGAATLAQSTVTVSSGSIQAGSSATVTLTAKDANGNQQASGGLAVAFSLGSGRR